MEARNWDRFEISLTDEDGLRIRRKPRAKLKLTINAEAGDDFGRSPQPVPLGVYMPDLRTERETCRFVARMAEGRRPVIILEFFHRTVSILDHAALSLNLLGGLTLENAKKLTDALNANALDASVAVSSEHLLFAGELLPASKSS